MKTQVRASPFCGEQMSALCKELEISWPALKEEIGHVDLPPVVIQIKAPDDNATE